MVVVLVATLIHSVRWEITFTSTRFIVVSWSKRWSHRAFPCRFHPWVGRISLLIKKTQLSVSKIFKVWSFFFLRQGGVSIDRSSDVKRQKDIFLVGKKEEGKHETGIRCNNVSKTICQFKFWNVIYTPTPYQLFQADSNEVRYKTGSLESFFFISILYPSLNCSFQCQEASVHWGKSNEYIISWKRKCLEGSVNLQCFEMVEAQTWLWKNISWSNRLDWKRWLKTLIYYF